MRYLTGLAAAVVLFSSTSVPAQTPGARAAAGAQREGGRLRLRRRPVERPSIGRRRPASDDGVGRGVESVVLARRELDRVYRPVRRERRCVRGPRTGWRAEAFDVASRSRHRARLDPRRQAGAVLVHANELLPLPGALSRRPRWRAGGEASASDGVRSRLFSIGRPPRVCAAVARVHGVEALSRRPGDADLDRLVVQQPRREDPARNIERLLPDVGRRQDLLSQRPDRARHALLVRHQDEEGVAGRLERRHGFQVRVRRPWRDRPRTVRADPVVRPGVRPADAPEDLDRRGHRRNATEVRQRREAPDERAHLADRRAGVVRGSRRDPDRSCRKRRSAQPDLDARRDGARPGVVAGRAVDRVLLGRERRVRAARPRFTGEKRAAEDTPRAEADLLSDAPVVARQQEDRVSGRASQHLVRGHRRAQAREGRQGSVSVPAARSASLSGRPTAGGLRTPSGCRTT